MVKAVTKTVYVAADGSEHLTEQSARVAEASVLLETACQKVENRLHNRIAYGKIDENDALAFMLDERELLRAWFDAFDARQEVLRVKTMNEGARRNG